MPLGRLAQRGWHRRQPGAIGHPAHSDLPRGPIQARHPGCEVRQDLDEPNVRAVSLADFDRYVEAPNPRGGLPGAFALWIAERTVGPVPRFEKVEREEPADGVVIEGDDV